MFTSPCSRMGWIDPEDWLNKIDEWPELGGGNEHLAYMGANNRVVKITRNPRSQGSQGKASIYLRNLVRQALIFGDTVKFEGLIYLEKGATEGDREDDEQAYATYLKRCEIEDGNQDGLSSLEARGDELQEGWAIVTSQDFVKGRKATRKEIDAYYTSYDLEGIDNDSYVDSVLKMIALQKING